MAFRIACATSLLLAIIAAGPAHSATMDDVKSLYQQHDYVGAMRELLPLAAAGDPEAQYVAGFMYCHGQGAAENLPRGLAWYRAAAEQGYAEAQFALGLMFDNGRGVAQDYEQAGKWYAKAAEQGLSRAQNNLGNLYNNGLGLPQDYAEAHMWYDLSNAGGDERAARNLQLMEQVMSTEDIAQARDMAALWTAGHTGKPDQP